MCVASRSVCAAVHTRPKSGSYLVQVVEPRFYSPELVVPHLASTCRVCRAWRESSVRSSLSLSPLYFEKMGHFILATLPPPQAAFPPAAPMAMFVASATPRHPWGVGCRYRRSLVGRAAAGDGAGDRSEGKHPEQKAGFRPPAPLEDDGFTVNIAELQDLVDSGENLCSLHTTGSVVVAALPPPTPLRERQV